MDIINIILMAVLFLLLLMLLVEQRNSGAHEKKTREWMAMAESRMASGLDAKWQYVAAKQKSMQQEMARDKQHAAANPHPDFF
jgi:hypothetical protein